MAVKNGMWNIITMRLCPGSMGIRHFIPLIFLLSLILLPILSFINIRFLSVFVCELILYVVLDIYFALKTSKKVKYILMVAVLFPIFHITYGFGSITGIVKLLKKEFKN